MELLKKQEKSQLLSYICKLHIQKLYFKLSDCPVQFAIKSNMTQHVAIFDVLQQYLRNNTSFLLDSNLNKHFSDTFQAPVTYSNLYIYHHMTVVLMESITIIPNANTPNFKTNQALFICESFRTILHSQRIYVLD